MASILVIEDDSNFCSTLVDLLSQFHAPVESAASAAEALEKANHTSFHLVLTDVRVAGPVDGVSALESIQALQPKTRSIIMTGYADLDVPMRAARLQADDYLQKPFRLQRLLDSVRIVLEREPPVPRLFQRLLGAPVGAAQKVVRLLYDAHLQQLHRLRDDCLQRFFVLIRAGRLDPNQAYRGFCRWEELELEFLRDPPPQAWKKLAQDFAKLGENWLDPGPDRPASIPRSHFEPLYQKVRTGLVDAQQLSRAVALWHDSRSRSENVIAYCTYHWLWKDGAGSQDPFLGLCIESYELKRLCHGSQSQVRLYEAVHTRQPRQGDRILCLPLGDDSDPLVEQELDSERATLLHTGMGHHFLIYRGHSLSLKHQLPAGGHVPRAAWNLLRPVFAQVQAYHQEGRCSGSFSLYDIDLLPGQACQLSHFSDKAYRALHRQMVGQGALRLELHAAPEVSSQPEPTPLSDQAVLGRILFEVIHGGSYPDPNTRLHLQFLGLPEANQHFGPFVGRLGPLLQPFYRLCHCQPSQRFASLAEALNTIDGLFPPAPS